MMLGGNSAAAASKTKIRVPAGGFPDAINGPSPVTALAAQTATLITDANGFHGSASASGFNAQGYTDQCIPSGMDGFVEMSILTTANQGGLMALDTKKTIHGYGSNAVYVYLSGANLYYGVNTTSPTNLNYTITPSAGMKIRLYRRMTSASTASFVICLSDTYGQWWREYLTITGAPTGALYPQWYCNANVYISNPAAGTYPVRTNVNIVIDGNSQSYGAISGTNSMGYSGGWASILSQWPKYKGATFTNFAVTAQTTTQMLSDVTTQIDPALVTTAPNILIAMEVRNDIYNNGTSVSGAQISNAQRQAFVNNYLQTYMGGRRTAANAAGKSLVIVGGGCFDCDMSIAGTTTTNVGETAANYRLDLTAADSLIMAQGASYCDAVMNLRGASFLYPCTSTWYADGTHGTVAWYIAFAAYVDTYISQYLGNY